MRLEPSDRSAAEDVLVSVVVPLRDRGGFRLENCLRSLRWQDATGVEIIISDFGSAPEFSVPLEAKAAEHEARIERTETDEVWNRARALNVGIRAARGRYVLCTDADMIFQPNFLTTLLEAQARSGDRAFAVCRCLDLPPQVAEQVRERGDFESLRRQARYRVKLGTGACQMAARSFFEDVRGYDERYRFWGMEDNDMRFRASRWGLSETWVHDDTAMLHQWHPSDRGRRPLRKFLNDARFHLTKYRVRKNRRRWGLKP